MASDGRGPPPGARVIGGRLTAELILRSPQYMNCVGQYELDLRGNRLTAIENLGATENQFDCIDLTDNSITRLDGLPRLRRLRCLLLGNNRVARLAPGLAAAAPALEWLVLTNNRLAGLADLEPLAALPRLRYLSLAGCPVAAHPQYRAFVVARLPRLKVLDFRRVRAAERAAAEAAFPPGAPAPARAGGGAEDGGGAAPGGGGAAAPRKGPTPEQLTAIKAAIAGAATLEEVERLEASLKAGAAGGDAGGAAEMEEG